MALPAPLPTLFRVAFVAALVTITRLATTPVVVEIHFNLGDKVLHLAAFFALALLADFAFERRPFVRDKALPLAAYGMAIEIVQHFLPYRSFSLLDWAADLAGVGLYAASVPLLRRVPGLRRRWQSLEGAGSPTTPSR